MDAVESMVDSLREYAKDSVRLIKCYHKPDRKEFTKMAARTANMFVVMGFIGFFIKLIFIPINRKRREQATVPDYSSLSSSP